MQSGTPAQYIALLAASADALQQTLGGCVISEAQIKPIQIPLHLFPRPAALLEAVRRYEGFVRRIELDRVVLRASLRQPKGQCVVLEKGSCRLIGAAYGAGFSFTERDQALPPVAISADGEGKAVPFYTDRARTARMPVENILFEANDGAQAFIDVYGVYCCLDGR